MQISHPIVYPWCCQTAQADAARLDEQERWGNTVNPGDVNASQVLFHKMVTICFSTEGAIVNSLGHELAGCFHYNDCPLLLGVL